MSITSIAKKDSQLVLNSLSIRPGAIIADIGSGGGYFTFEFVKRTGAGGKIFAVDTNQALLAHIENAIKNKRLDNIKTIMGA